MLLHSLWTGLGKQAKVAREAISMAQAKLLWTVYDAGEALGLSPWTIRRWIDVRTLGVVEK
jgi:hypothetical protein